MVVLRSMKSEKDAISRIGWLELKREIRINLKLTVSESVVAVIPFTL